MEKIESWPTRVNDRLTQKILEKHATIERLRAEIKARENGLSTPSDTSTRTVRSKKRFHVFLAESPPLSDIIEATSSTPTNAIGEPTKPQLELLVPEALSSLQTTILGPVEPSSELERTFYQRISRDFNTAVSGASPAEDSNSGYQTEAFSDFEYHLRDADSVATLQSPTAIVIPSLEHGLVRRDFATSPRTIERMR